MNTPVQYQALHPLLGKLRGAGVELPTEVTGAVAILEDVDSLSRQVLVDSPVDPLTADRDQWVDAIRRRAATHVAGQQLGPQMWAAIDEITTAVAAVLADHADNLIAQLAPRFDQAAKPLYAATKIGITSGTTADDVITLGPKAVGLWRVLPEHADVLDDIAALRIEMTDVLDVAPGDGHFEPRRYAAAFGSGAEWETRDRRSQSGVGRWLRLSAQDEPLRLLNLDETHALDLAGRAPISTMDPEGFVVSEVAYR